MSVEELDYALTGNGQMDQYIEDHTAAEIIQDIRSAVQAPAPAKQELVTLRDRFAMSALPSLMTNLYKELEGGECPFCIDEDARTLAQDCYDMADAMLEAREVV